ncbi:GGDEF domain-containing protein [Methylobacterium sp. J-076]|uniref:GGDEF domain-containing protein n=1 Tax=Methylobacterium sp. J-076 TaxID=2836655 RepID=UPI001FBC0E7E|nr:GGDEF domain-containing protein [Methylobacterium sp. J-076]MCJ2013412.1 GGDEF domain-containing protein [Methylobacterium sp. J-076]
MALVADLAHSPVPTSIMGLTLVGVNLFTYAATGSVILLAAAIWGGLSCVAKLGLMAWQAHHTRTRPAHARMTTRFEAAHALVTLGMASAVGAGACSVFRQPDVQLQLLATGMMFGYGSGIVGRVAIRPLIAVAALIVAGTPAIIAAASWENTTHRLTALIFGVFLVGSFESVRHVHRTAVWHVATRIKMARLARNDPLTGVANRLGLREAFGSFAPQAGTSVAVHSMDLDGFKIINDRFGHAAGDTVLAEIARRLVAAVPEDATVARIGGDEFVVLQRHIHRPGEVEDLAKAVNRALREPIAVAGRNLSVGVSLGYAWAGADGCRLEELLRHADEASYRIKRMGGGIAACGGGATAEAATLRNVA